MTALRAALDRVDAAVAAIRADRAAVLLPGSGRAGPVVVHAATGTSSAAVVDLLGRSAGIVYVALPAADAARLRLDPMEGSGPTDGLEMLVTVDLLEGTTTGISAGDRALTVRALADGQTRHDAFARPGHVVPLRADDDGVVGRAGPAEAAVDLVAMAGRGRAAMLAEAIELDGEQVGPDRIEAWATAHGLPIVAVDDVVAHRWCRDELVDPLGADLPPLPGLVVRAFRSRGGPVDHVFSARGRGRHSAPSVPTVNVLVECRRMVVAGAGAGCDCAADLAAARQQLVVAGGHLVYLAATSSALRCPAATDGAAGARRAWQILRHLDVRSFVLARPEGFDADEIAAHGLTATAMARVAGF